MIDHNQRARGPRKWLRVGEAPQRRAVEGDEDVGHVQILHAPVAVSAGEERVRARERRAGRQHGDSRDTCLAQDEHEAECRADGVAIGVDVCTDGHGASSAHGGRHPQHCGVQ